MKRIFALTIVCFTPLGLTQIASAGPEPLPGGKEMKQVVQPVVQENCNWTGFYIGAQVGYGGGDLKWQDADTSIAPEPGADTSGVTDLTHTSQSGFLAGGQFGYNHQFGRFVVGAEGDFAHSEAKGNHVTFGEVNTDSFETRNDWLASAALRVGITYRQFLFYVKGGAAFTHLRYSWKHGVSNNDEENAHVDSFDGDEWRVGPMVGGGIEYMINCQWSATLEYNHIFLGTDSFDGTNTEADTGPEPETFQSKLGDIDSVRVGVNYKFWPWGDHNPGMTMGGVERLDYKSGPAPLPIEEPCRWTGFYIGGHIGDGWGDATWRDADTGGIGAEAAFGPEATFLVDQHQGGFLGGGQAGYNYQIGSWFVIGAEGDFSYSDVRARSVKKLSEEANIFETSNDWLGTVAGRIGVTFHHVLFYGKGGVAFVHERYGWDHGDFFGPIENQADKFRADDTYAAGMAGGGIEYAINCHWSVKGEYNHIFLGTEDIHGTRIDDGIPEQETFRVDLNHDSVKFGLNYKF